MEFFAADSQLTHGSSERKKKTYGMVLVIIIYLYVYFGSCILKNMINLKCDFQPERPQVVQAARLSIKRVSCESPI